MTETIDTAHPEALRLAILMDAMDYDDTRAAAQELRRLHAANVYTSDLCTQALDEVRQLTSALAAAEARNATLTDEAARAKWIEQNLTYADFRNGEYINVALWSTDDRAVEIRNAIDTMARGEDR